MWEEKKNNFHQRADICAAILKAVTAPWNELKHSKKQQEISNWQATGFYWCVFTEQRQNHAICQNLLSCDQQNLLLLLTKISIT